MAIHLRGRKTNRSSATHRKVSPRSAEKTSEKRSARNKTARPIHNKKQKPIPQKVLLHAARAVPTPDIFNDVPDEMPFSTENDK